MRRELASPLCPARVRLVVCSAGGPPRSRLHDAPCPGRAQRGPWEPKAGTTPTPFVPPFSLGLDVSVLLIKRLSSVKILLIPMPAGGREVFGGARGGGGVGTCGEQVRCDEPHFPTVFSKTQAFWALEKADIYFLSFKESSFCVWSLCSATGEAAIVRGPHTAMKSGPCSPQLEKALAQKRRLNTAINK